METKQSLSVRFGAGGGAGNKAEADRDALAGLGKRKGPVQLPVLAAAPQARSLPEGGLGACPQSQDIGAPQWNARLCPRDSHSCRKILPARCTRGAGWSHCTLCLVVVAQCRHSARVILDSESFPDSLLLHLYGSTCPTTSTEEIPLLEQPLGTCGYSGKGPIPKDTRVC